MRLQEECREDLVCFVMNVYWENRTVCLARAPIWLWLALCSVHGR